MDQKAVSLSNQCNFSGVRPIIMNLPYPMIQVREKNMGYANLLRYDYCGSVSELTAITQYINHENFFAREKCQIAQTILGIAMAEMMHLQKLTELIVLLGGDINFTVQNKGRQYFWTPEYISFSGNLREMILEDMKGEKDAISQYEMHIKMINDPYITAILARIIQDEEYHIMLLQSLLKEIV